MHICFLLITYVNGMATCSVACINRYAHQHCST